MPTYRELPEVIELVFLTRYYAMLATNASDS